MGGRGGKKSIKEEGKERKVYVYRIKGEREKRKVHKEGRERGLSEKNVRTQERR